MFSLKSLKNVSKAKSAAKLGEGGAKSVDVVEDVAGAGGKVRIESGSAGINSGKIAAISKEVSPESIIRVLRQSNTPKGSAVAKMLKRGIVKLNIKKSHPLGYAGLKPHGNNEIFIYTNAVKTPQVAAGYTAHEAKHFLQKLTASTYRKIHEFEAYSFQAKVDKTFPLRTSEEIWDFINNQPAYKNVRD